MAGVLFILTGVIAHSQRIFSKVGANAQEQKLLRKCSRASAQFIHADPSKCLSLSNCSLYSYGLMTTKEER
jgi:hypothetical protein